MLMMLVFYNLHLEEELSCAEAMRHSGFDQFVAGRYFFFYYSSEIALIWLFLNLPALMLSSLMELVIRPLTFATVTGHDLSWIRAGFIVITASAQWALIGYGLSRWRRRTSYK